MMGFSSINTNFAYTSPSNVNENTLTEIMDLNTLLDSTTGTITSSTTCNTSYGVLRSELIQPNAFLDYGIDLYNSPLDINTNNKTHAHGAIQPNAFIDYGIDLNYKGSSSTTGINVGNLSKQTINSERNSANTSDNSEVIGFESYNPIMFFYNPNNTEFIHILKNQIDEIIEFSGFGSTANEENITENSPNFLKMFFNFI